MPDGSSNEADLCKRIAFKESIYIWRNPTQRDNARDNSGRQHCPDNQEHGVSSRCEREETELMTNYENSIMELLQGETRKQKYENLQKMIAILEDGNPKCIHCGMTEMQHLYDRWCDTEEANNFEININN